jgi:hypothetical protein
LGALACVQSSHTARTEISPLVRNVINHTRSCAVYQVHNAIGAGNHRYYIALLTVQLVHLLLIGVLTIIRLRLGALPEGGMGPALLLMLAGSVGVVADAQVLSQQCRQISQNITTHEFFNAHRLNYLWADPRRTFFNPFDRGTRHNWFEFCGLDRAAPDWTCAHIFSIWDIATHPLQEEARRALEARRQSPGVVAPHGNPAHLHEHAEAQMLRAKQMYGNLPLATAIPTTLGGDNSDATSGGGYGRQVVAGGQAFEQFMGRAHTAETAAQSTVPAVFKPAVTTQQPLIPPSYGAYTTSSSTIDMKM